MKFLKYAAMIIPLVFCGCNNSNGKTNKKPLEQADKINQKQSNNTLIHSKHEKFQVSICEPDYQSLNYCTAKFQKLFQEESQKPANFDKNKRVIVTKVQMKHNKKGIYEHHLVVLDLETKKAYPLSQVVTSFSDEKSYLISEQPKINYDTNSNKICFSGSLIGYRDSYDNVDNACYEFNEKDQSFIPTNIPFTERKIASETTNVTTKSAIKTSNLPFTPKNIDSNGEGLLDVKGTLLADPKFDREIDKFLGGASAGGYYQLPNLGSIQVFVGYGLFENEDQKHVTKENPDGAFTEQESYLITINGNTLNHINLGDKFYIGENYQDIYTVSSEGKKTYFKISPNGSIIKQ